MAIFSKSAMDKRKKWKPRESNRFQTSRFTNHSTCFSQPLQNCDQTTKETSKLQKNPGLENKIRAELTLRINR